MKLVSILLTLGLSYLGVWAQAQFPVLTQWIFIYVTVFVVSWIGGFINGIVATVVSLTLAGFILIPWGAFSLHDFVQILVLSSLGFWISFSMDQYKKSRIKISASDELEKSLGFLDTLLENIPMMVFVKDAVDLRFVKFNKAGLDLVGFQREEIIGKNDLDMFPPEQATHFINYDREVLKKGGIIDIPFETLNTKSRGQRILHTKKIPIMDKNGTPLYLLGVSEDVTDKIESERLQIQVLAEDAAKMERLKMQERETFVAQAISSLSSTLDYQETLNRLVTILVPTLGDWCILTVKNDEGQFERVESFHSDPDLQPYLSEFIKLYPPSPEDLEIQKALLKGESSLSNNLNETDLKARSQDPHKFDLYRKIETHSSMIIPVKVRDQVHGAISIARNSRRPAFDELDLILAEEIGRRAGTVLENSLLFKSTQKAVKARDEFLSIASHELKTPITSLKMQIQMLQRSSQNEKIEKPLQLASRQINRLTLLVNDLLDVSRFDSGKMSYNFENLHLGPIVLEVQEMVKNDFHTSGTDLTVFIDNDAEIKGDKYRLEQVIVNLFNNAHKYGAGKAVEIRLFSAEKEICLSVKDNGKGIPAELQNKIFEKFERGRQDSNISGLGLGLFISKEIMTAHGGRIDVESDGEHGSTFTMRLPLI